MDSLGIVDDGCLDSYDMAKGVGSSGGGRVHSIDVILGFTKDQDSLLHTVGEDSIQKASVENQQHEQNNVDKEGAQDPYRHLPELGNGAQHSSYNGKCVHPSSSTLTLLNTRSRRQTIQNVSRYCFVSFVESRKFALHPFPRRDHKLDSDCYLACKCHVRSARFEGAGLGH